MCALVLNAMDHLQFGNKILLLSFLATLQPSTALIDCRTACRKCHDNSEDRPILEVYCAMCEECKQRRREKLQLKTTETIRPPTLERKSSPNHDISYEEQPATGFSVPWTMRTSPTMNPNYDYLHNTRGALRTNIVYPPGCPTPPSCPESHEVTATLPETTQPTTTTTQCPSIVSCRKKKRHEYSPCLPLCYPPCPCPGQAQPTQTTEKQFYNVYVGVPRNLLRNG